jgi:hypothetical protein
VRLRLYSGLLCSLPIATARCRACSRFVVANRHVGLVLCVGLLSVCDLVCDVKHSDDALPIGLPQSDYLAHLPDYVYGSHQRFAHRLSCIRFCARWSNGVTAGHPTTLRQA